VARNNAILLVVTSSVPSKLQNLKPIQRKN
jgi:hypothetical protein